MEKYWRNSFLKSVAWVRELRKYTRSQIAAIFGFEEQSPDYDLFLIKFQKEGILKCLDGLLVLNGESETSENSAYLKKTDEYVFTYVGLCCQQGYLVCVLPKYVTNAELEILTPPNFSENSSSDLAKKLSQILKVLREYENKKIEKNLIHQTFSGDSQSYLSLLVTILEDYAESGQYREDEHVLRVNGSGRIMWHNTINTCAAYIKDSNPVYVDVVNRHLVADEEYFITRLHRLIVKDCYNQLSCFGVMQLLELPEVDFIEGDIEELGDMPYLLYRVEQELCSQFDSRRRHILQLLSSYLDARSYEASADKESYTFGTNCFNLLWEDVCRCTLGKDEKDKFSISPPEWSMDEARNAYTQPLKLDMLFIEDEKAFVMDAKYYHPHCNDDDNRVYGLPGVEDITKQFLYKQAIMNNSALKSDPNRKLPTRAYNAFLMPQVTENEDVGLVQHYASVTMPLFVNERIDAYRLEPTVLYDAYINGIECSEVRDALRFSLEYRQSN